MTTLPTLGPRIAIAVLLVATLAGCRAGEKKTRILDRADRYLRAGEYDEAKIEYLNLLRLDRRNTTAIQQLGSIWFEQGAPLQAYPYLVTSRELDPANFNARTKLALVLMSLGEVENARKEAIAVLRDSPRQDEAILLLADTTLRREDLEPTRQQLQELNEPEKASVHLALATLAIRQGDLRSAEAETERALALEPKSASAHLAMAAIDSLRRDWNKAGAEFQTAAELSPARSAARLKYAEFERQIGKGDQANLILKEITRQAPDYSPAWCLLAQSALAQNHYEEATSLLENVLTRDPVNLNGLILQSQAWIGQGEAKKAVGEMERLATAFPNVPLINYHLARTYLADNNSNAAATAINDAIAAKPDYTEAVLLQGEINLRNGNAPLVVPAMLGLLKQQPSLVPAQSLLAEAYRASGRLDEAAATVREQIRASLPTADAYLRLGLILDQQHKTDDARKAFEHALELAPDNLAALDQLVELNIVTKNFDVALHRVEQKLEQEPNSARAYFIKGKIYVAQAEWDRAELALRKALDLDPAFWNAFDLLISTYISTNKLTQAINELQTLLAKSPTDTRLLTTLALTYDKMKDYPLARDAYERLLSITPDSAVTINNLAYLYAEHFDQLDKACELARKARALQPSDPLIADTLGWTLYKRADYQEAVTLLRESAEKLPDNLTVEFHFGMASYMMADTKAAHKALQRALGADVDFPGKPEAQRRLQFLGNGEGSPERMPTGQIEAVVKEQPDDVVAWMRLGASFESQAAYARAVSAYERALQVNPELLPAAVKLAELYEGPLPDKNRAFEFAKWARDLAPNDPQVAGFVGVAAYQLGNFTWAYNLFQESAFRLTMDAKVQHNYAWSAYAVGKTREARKAMERVIEMRPDPKIAEDAKSFLVMTALEQNPEHLATSEPEIQKILATSATYVPALLARADLQVQRGDTKSAAAIYNHILRRYPDFAPAQKRLASLYLEDPARIAEAYDLALRARNTLPDDPELAQTLGEISFKRKEFAYAIQWFQESARKKPLRGSDLYYLGISQLQTSNESAGRKTLEQALNAGLQEPLAREAKGALTELQKRQDF